MAATVANVEHNVLGGGPGGRWAYAEVTLDSAYATGGEGVTAASLGFAFFKAVFVAHNEDGYIIQASLDSAKTTVTFKVWIGSAATTSASVNMEVNTRDLSAVVIPVLIRGI